jgi:hypothetical protein
VPESAEMCKVQASKAKVRGRAVARPEFAADYEAAKVAHFVTHGATKCLTFGLIRQGGGQGRA